MTWVEEYRQSIGMSRREFATAITAKLGGRGDRRVLVTPAILTIIETWPNARTHPRIMNAIARACGATKEMRDEFLHPCRRGFPYTHTAAAVTERAASPWRSYTGATTQAAMESAKRYASARPVVVIDRMGQVVFRAVSANAAEGFTGMSAKTVLTHCNHAVKFQFFQNAKYIFRYAEEWDAMSPSARAREVSEALASSTMKAYDPKSRAVVVIGKTGREIMRYESIAEAARGEATTLFHVKHRCQRRAKREFTGDIETTYRFAAEWDSMNQAQRMEDLGVAQ